MSEFICLQSIISVEVKDNTIS